MEPHPAYTGSDMPSRQLEFIVKQALKTGAGIEPVAIAENLFKIASREEKVPLHLPLGSTAFQLIKMKLESRLAELETLKDFSVIDK